MRTEIGDRDDLPGVGIDERLEPRASRIVADLHNVRQGDVAVILDEVLEGRGVVVVVAVEGVLSVGNRVLEGKRRVRRREAA